MQQFVGSQWIKVGPHMLEILDPLDSRRKYLEELFIAKSSPTNNFSNLVKWISLEDAIILLEEYAIPEEDYPSYLKQ